MLRETGSYFLRIASQLSVVVMIAMLLMIGPTFAQKRLALVVGNDSYENVTKLRKAANDARGMGDTLSGLGFDVTTVTNVSRREMNRTLQTFTNSISPNDTVLFFFAGHGVEIDGENYLLPIDVPDAKSDQLEFIKSETIRLNTVLQDLRDRKANLNLVILDACRNNPFSKKAGRSLGSEKGLARISAPQGTFVMYSADVGETALDRLSDDDNSPNSVFTRTLIPLMKTPGIDLVDTARQARREVRKLALSVSHEQTPAYYDAVLGDFFFTPPLSKGGKTDNSVKIDKIITPEVEPDKKTFEFDVALREDVEDKDTRLRPLLDQNTEGFVPALVVTAGEKDLIRLWDADKMELLAELKGEKKLISAVKLINKGHTLLVAGLDRSVIAYSMPSFKKTNAFYVDFEISAITQTSDGTLMMGGESGLLAAYDGKTFKENWRRQAHDGIVSPILQVGDEVYSASEDGQIVSTNIRSGRATSGVFTFAGGKITDFAFVDANTVVAVHEKGKVVYIDLRRGKILRSFKGHDGWISSVDVTPDGRAIVTAGVNGILKFWSIGRFKLIKSVPAHSDVASGAKFMSIDTVDRLISAGFDGILRIWSQKNNYPLSSLEHGPAIIHFDYVSSQ